jgi:hypothetical protein
MKIRNFNIEINFSENQVTLYTYRSINFLVLFTYTDDIINISLPNIFRASLRNCKNYDFLA